MGVSAYQNSGHEARHNLSYPKYEGLEGQTSTHVYVELSANSPSGHYY